MDALHSETPRISVIVPALNEAGRIRHCLEVLRALGECEVIVVDGGSRDGTLDEAVSSADRVLESDPGRARQMNAGAGAARGEILWFVHADTRPPAGALDLIRQCLRSGRQWGRFDVRLDGRHPAFRVIERFINWRSALSGIATGDQALFVSRSAWETVGGFPDIALMEDVALSRSLKRLDFPARVREPAVSSSRRWERHGILKTVWLMWRLRFAYWRGAHPDDLAARYAGRRPEGKA
jgi:rSAM/selenodomain-associated transferase 2